MCLFKCLLGPRERPALRGTQHLRAQGSPTGLPQPRPGPPEAPQDCGVRISPLSSQETRGPWGRRQSWPRQLGTKGECVGQSTWPQSPAPAPPTPTRRRPHPGSYSVPRPWHRPGGRDRTGTIAWLVVSGTQKCAFTSPTRPGLCPPGARGNRPRAQLGKMLLWPTTPAVGSRD